MDKHAIRSLSADELTMVSGGLDGWIQCSYPDEGLYPDKGTGCPKTPFEMMWAAFQDGIQQGMASKKKS